MRRFNVMLNGSRLMMFPFYVCILICVALLMVKFAMQLYVLCRDIIERHAISADRVLAHSDIAPGRKTDPGPWFDWDQLWRDG